MGGFREGAVGDEAAWGGGGALAPREALIFWRETSELLLQLSISLN